MKLSPRELATVLAALRETQISIQLEKGWQKNAFPGHFVDVEPLSLEEIDELCDRLNMAPKVRRRTDG